MPEPAAVAVLLLTGGVFALLLPFAAHRTRLLFLARRRRDEIRRPWPEAELPVVTVQLPMYNERTVAARAIDAACGLDYPVDRLEVQVLDDSDDETSWIVEERVGRWRARGIDIEHVRRAGRTGFKAGALAHGTERARGEFVLVLDADFVAPPGLIRDLLPPMQDERVGMVQAAWGHLNRDANRLTEAQSFLLDGHFLWEQGGRYRGGRFFNFNGTAGLWRRRAIDEAGGWRFDTLTEDLDLSYRAQMAGWRFVYLDDVVVPAEIPETVAALEVQQRRWAQGGVQTGRRILPGLLRGPFPLAIKAEAVVHLMGHLAHPLTWLLVLLLFPSAVARRTLGLEHLLGLDLVLFGGATVPFLLFYWLAGEARGRPRRGRLRAVLRTLAMGIGLTIPVTGAVLRGLRRRADPFERTPKRGAGGRPRYRLRARHGDAVLRLAMAVLVSIYLALAIAGGYWGQLPFLLLFLSGYVALGLPAWAEASGARLGGALDPSAGDQACGLDREQREEGHPERETQGDGLRPAAPGLPAPEPEVAEECEAA